MVYCLQKVKAKKAGKKKATRERVAFLATIHLEVVG